MNTATLAWARHGDLQVCQDRSADRTSPTADAARQHPCMGVSVLSPQPCRFDGTYQARLPKTAGANVRLKEKV
jgi:hypothetical protein